LIRQSDHFVISNHPQIKPFDIVTILFLILIYLSYFFPSTASGGRKRTIKIIKRACNENYNKNIFTTAFINTLDRL
jgi:hypothetical protein